YRFDAEAEVMARTMPMGSSGRHPVVTADRLSSLPDGLLHTIMSFLKARQAVQTCVLSRRWEKLWCSMPCLDIDQREFAVAPPHGRVKESDDFPTLGCFLSNAPSLEKLTLQYCKLSGGSRKRKRMAKRISFKCLNTLTFKCPKLKLIEIKYKENDVHQLFGLLSGVWRNLPKTTIQLIKA
ncbi:hypothetical protein EJB05_37833, partial [Eragrostis curvula]